MIRKGDLYEVQAGNDSRQEGLVLVVSGDDLGTSEYSNVTVLPVVSSRKGVAPGFEVAFEVGAEGVKVQPPNLTAVPRNRLQGAAVGRLSGELLDRVDTLIVLHLALSPASLEGPGIFVTPDDGEAT